MEIRDEKFKGDCYRPRLDLTPYLSPPCPVSAIIQGIMMSDCISQSVDI